MGRSGRRAKGKRRGKYQQADGSRSRNPGNGHSPGTKEPGNWVSVAVSGCGTVALWVPMAPSGSPVAPQWLPNGPKSRGQKGAGRGCQTGFSTATPWTALKCSWQPCTNASFRSRKLHSLNCGATIRLVHLFAPSPLETRYIPATPQEPPNPTHRDKQHTHTSPPQCPRRKTITPSKPSAKLTRPRK